MISKFSQELKDQVIKEVIETGSSVAVARKHNLNPKTVNNWICSVRNKDVMDSNKQIRNLQKKTC